MKRSKNLVLPHRRKREGKTDYRLRLRLLKSRKLRFVVRKSLNNVICQIIKYEMAGDRVVISADSKELKKFGWNFHSGNIPSAYLTGFLLAEKAKKHKVKEAILDIGLYVSSPGNRLYSALKGAVDGGLEIPHSEKALPKQERISGRHITDHAEKLKSSDSSKYRKIFSAYLKNKLDPKDMPKVLEETKKNISTGKHVHKKPAAKKEHAKKETKEHKKTASKKKK